jgi:hypothetical protein
MTNNLRDQDPAFIEAVRDVIQSVVARPNWEVVKLSERLRELKGEEAEEDEEDMASSL